MKQFWVELSGENPALARAELAAAVATDGGTVVASPPADGLEGIVEVELSSDASAHQLASRLALGHRILEPWGELSSAEALHRLVALGTRGAHVRFRIHDQATNTAWRPAIDAFLQAGGVVDLSHPVARIEVVDDRRHRYWIAEERFLVNRADYEHRRPSRLPFRRPVTLPPRLGRVLVNLARIRPDDAVVDPFLGTGALAVEAALVGARVTGLDHQADMVRGALRNFAHLGADAAEFRVGDAGAAGPPARGGRWDALITDPPYGRSSPSGAESSRGLVERVLQAWSSWMRPTARMALVVPTREPLDLPGWTTEVALPHRAHRSLTREFRVYVRG